MTLDQHDSPLRQGREARLRGDCRTSNPYRKLTKKGGAWGELLYPLSADWWDAGWDETDREQEREDAA